MGESWEWSNTNSEPGKSYWLAKGNLEEMPPQKWFKHHKVTTLSLSPSMCLATCTLFLPNKHLTCFTTFPLHAKIHFYITDMPRSCHWPLFPGGLEARIQHSAMAWLHISGWEPKFCFKTLQAEATTDHHLCSILLIYVAGKIRNCSLFWLFQCLSVHCLALVCRY